MQDLLNGRRVPTAATLIVAGAVVGATLLTILLWRRDRLVVEENHLVEWTQAGLLFLAALVHGARIAPAPGRAGRTIRMGMTLLCLSFLLREVDIDELWRPEIMDPVERAIRSALALVWVGFLWWGRRSISPVWAARRVLLTCRFSILAGLGCACYVASWPFDKLLLSLDDGLLRLIEETLQLNATVFFILGAAAPLPAMPSVAPGEPDAPQCRA